MFGKTETIAAYKIVRVKNCFFEPKRKIYSYKDLLSELTDQGFVLSSNDPDGFYELFQNPDFTNANRNTLVKLNISGPSAEIEYIVANPE